jgi:hypothetical protein
MLARTSSHLRDWTDLTVKLYRNRLKYEVRKVHEEKRVNDEDATEMIRG